MTYKLSTGAYVTRGDGARIGTADSVEFPNTNANYLEYKDWLEAGGVPDAADQDIQAMRSDIVVRLAQLDAESVRPLRAKAAGSATEDDDAKLLDLDADAASLRLELSALK